MPSLYQGVLDFTVSLPLDPPGPNLIAIYGLYEPGTLTLRYVGKATLPRDRYRKHIGDNRIHAEDYRARWLRKMYNSGRKPDMRVLAWVPVEEWQEAETAYIAEGFAQGFALVNTAKGGGGVMVGRKHTPETLDHIRQVLKGIPKTPEHRAKIAAGKRGKKQPQSQYDAAVAAHRTPESRAANSARIKQWHADHPEFRWDVQAKIKAHREREAARKGTMVQLPLF